MSRQSVASPYRSLAVAFAVLCALVAIGMLGCARESAVPPQPVAVPSQVTDVQGSHLAGSTGPALPLAVLFGFLAFPLLFARFRGHTAVALGVVYGIWGFAHIGFAVVVNNQADRNVVSDFGDLGLWLLIAILFTLMVIVDLLLMSAGAGVTAMRLTKTAEMDMASRVALVSAAAVLWPALGFLAMDYLG